MHALWAAIVAATTRRRGPRPPRRGPSLGQMLWHEVRWAAGQAWHPVKMAAAALVVVGVGVALGPTTPGPVLGAGLRVAVSTVLGLGTIAVAHVLLQRRGAADEPLGTLRVVVASVAMMVVGAIVLASLLAVVTGSTADGDPGRLSASLRVDAALLGGALLLVAGVLTAGISDRLAVPGALLFLLLGMLIGQDGLGLVDIDDPILAQSLGVAALVVILFDGGLATDLERLRRGIGPGMVLATVGVGITAGITAVGAMWLLDVPPRIAWLLGAIVSSTDAAAVFSLLRRIPLPRRITDVLQVESGANDPVGVLLTVGLLSAWDAPPTAAAWLGFGAQQMLGGLAVGVVVGGAGALLLRRVDLGADGLYPVLGLAVGGVAYGAAVSIGASGFLATYVAGIVIAAEAARRRRGIRLFTGALSSGVEVGLFLLLGLLVVPSDLTAVAGTALAISAILIGIARPLATVLSLAWFDVPPRETIAVAWLGIRGAVPIVLATLAFSAGVEEAPLIFDVVFFVVLTSALVQGATAARVVRALGIAVPASPATMMVEALPLDHGGVDVVEVYLDEGSPLVGRQLQAAPPPPDALVAAVGRGAAVLVPRGTTQLLAGDLLVVVTTDQADGIESVQAWVTGAPPRDGGDEARGGPLPPAVAATRPARGEKGRRD